MSSSRRILLTLPDAAWPPDRGKRIRAGTTMAGLAAHGELHVVVLADDFSTRLPPGMTVASIDSVRLQHRPRSRALYDAAAHRLPWQIAVRDWSSARAAVSGFYDLAWFGCTDHATQLGDALTANARVVDMDDIETVKIAGFLASAAGSRRTRWQRRVELPWWARLEADVTSRADRVVVCSELDRSRLGAPNVRVVRNCYPDPGPQPRHPCPEMPQLLFVANYDYGPNLDAAEFLVGEVLPLVRSDVPRVRLRLVGRNGTTRLAHLADVPGVDVVGAVDDPGEELRTATVSVAPVRFGGGTRIKILESFAFGVPTVSTALGCEGLDVTAGQDLLVADDPAAFAEACLTLLRDAAEADRIGRAGRAVFEQRFRPQVAQREVKAIVSELLGGAPA